MNALNTQLPRHLVTDLVARALAEDVGTGDITTAATVPPGTMAQGRIVAKAAGTVAGLPVAAEVFRQVDPEVSWEPLVADGTALQPGTEIARLSGSAASLLAGERVALNLLQHLSGIATATRAFVEACSGTKARVADTRKTLPGLRALQKYAVRMGGGQNHRYGLYDAVLIKDNHIAVAGGVAAAVQAARRSASHMVRVEVEVDTLEQLREALEAGADLILLDNMDREQLRRAVAITAGRAVLEASGGINLQNVRAVAETGVDLISVGALTHSARALDLSLELELA